MQRIGLLHFLKLRESGNHVLDGIEAVDAGRVLAVLVCEMRIVSNKLLEISHELVNGILHVLLSVFDPDLVLFANLHVLLLRAWPFLNDGLVRHFISLLNLEEIVGHCLVGEFVQKGRV